MTNEVNEAAEEILQLITTKGTAKWLVVAYLADEDLLKRYNLYLAAIKLYDEGFLDVKILGGSVFYFKTEKANQYRRNSVSIRDSLKEKERGLRA